MIVIIDYKTGNTGSILNMFKKIGADVVLSSDKTTIEQADKLVLPGVGAFDNGITKLNESGLVPLLNEKVLIRKTPIIGFCLAMQLFGNSSEEGMLPGLNWIPANTVKFSASDLAKNGLKIPHMGWNEIIPNQQHPLIDSLIGEEARFYFVHSYYVVCNKPENMLATTHYGLSFTSMIIKENIVGTQFHPEKSHKWGAQLLKNFIEKV